VIFYGGRIFRPVKTEGFGDVDTETIFRYRQKNDVVTAEYSGGHVKFGHLMGIIDTNGHIDISYHHLNAEHRIMTGTCHSRPEVLDNGKIRLHETWQWTSGDKSSGTSVLEEI